MSKSFAEVISIGDELTSGQRLDTNSQWVSQQLEELGMTVLAHQTIGDYLEPMQNAFQIAAGRSQIVVVTGGLGPTQDDLTRQALAKAFGSELYFDDASWEDIQKRFRSRGINPPESNRLQAWFPSGSRPIFNAYGTAPGISWTIARSGRQSQFFCLPGVPVEMREMFLSGVAPILATRQADDKQVVVQKVIKTFGAGESHVESLLPNLIARGNDPQVGITASEATISLRLRTVAPTQELGEEKIRPVVATIKQCLGTLVFAEDTCELEDVVVEKLMERRQKLVVVEWGTRGMVSQRLDEAIARRQVGDSSDWSPFAGAVILPSRDAVERWLAPLEFPELQHDGSRQELLRCLAQTAAKRFHADLAVAGGPLPDAGADHPFEIVAIQSTNADDTASSARFTVLGHPSLHRPRATKQVLNHLRLLK
ncbi:MAG: damage-inducible protein CinA [Planctomycetaceae bacterium]|nr:damage-inducible protein CinA [Planctomycetaceae bacterium]